MTAIKVNIIGTGVRYLMEREVMSWWDSKDDGHDHHGHDVEHEKSKTTMQIRQIVVGSTEEQEGHEPIRYSFESVTHIHLTDSPQSILDQLNRSRR